MKMTHIAALLVVSVASSTQAQSLAATGPITAEYYYRIKWGSHDEFKKLYERNHAPIMREMQRQGFITRMEAEEPFTHLAGGPRWDLRVTVTYREAASATIVGSAFDRAFESTKARLYPNKATFQAEEARRFSLLEDHWDVIVAPVAN